MAKTALIETVVSATEADWSRETPLGFWDPARRLLRALRGYAAAQDRGGTAGRIARIYWVMSHRFWTVVTQADIPLGMEPGGGLILPHPNGVVIHPSARIGPNCLIFQQVTIGTSGSHDGVPIIEGHVDIGAGARILGPVRIGAHAIIGANAVVTCDVPEGMVAVGIPARVRPRANTLTNRPTPQESP